MNHLDFNFGNAFNHFLRTGGPGGFLLRYALLFGLIGAVIQLFSMWLNAPVYEIYLRIFTEGGGDIEPYMDDLNAASMKANIASAIVMPLGILYWMVFEAASQRRYMRGEGFRLRIGADEWRLLAIGLIFVGVMIGAYLGLVLLMLVPIGIGALIGGEAGIGIGAILALIALLAGLVLMLWLMARLSPAAALTIRDRQIQFTEAWRVSRGKAWTIVGAWVVWGLISFVVVMLVYALIIGLLLAHIGDLLPGLRDGTVPFEEITARLSRPSAWLPLVLLILVTLPVQGLFQHILAGPAALAARTDPDWAGPDALAAKFD